MKAALLLASIGLVFSSQSFSQEILSNSLLTSGGAKTYVNNIPVTYSGVCTADAVTAKSECDKKLKNIISTLESAGFKIVTSEPCPIPQGQSPSSCPTSAEYYSQGAVFFLK